MQYCAHDIVKQQQSGEEAAAAAAEGELVWGLA